MDTAILGGGCFWCIEAIFQNIKGVESVCSGYSGGHVENPSYEDVCTKKSGHIEVVEIKFDENQISYEKLLDIFFEAHDPTTLDRQGNDKGPQYKSAIFAVNDEQCKKANDKIAEWSKKQIYSDKIITEVRMLDIFYPAEDYHQNYFRNNPSQPYCKYLIAPKVEKFLNPSKD